MLTIQAVMPFENCYLFLFNVGDRRYGIPNREWDHVHETLDAKNIKLGALVERGVSVSLYTYDFGDDWRHSVRIENVTAADPTLDYPRFVDGSRRAPPEDVGGIPASMSSSTPSPSRAIPTTSVSRNGTAAHSIARMRGSSTRRKRCPCRTAMPRSSRKARI